MQNILIPSIVKTRSDFLNYLPKNLICAEIGVFKGDFSKIIFEKMNPQKLYLVDMFSGIFGSGDKDGLNIEYVDLNIEYEKLIKFFHMKENVFVIKDNSMNFLKNLDNNYLDFIYIDADHSYSAVKNDLIMSFDKIKPGGYICGHDYNPDKFPSVVKAVLEFCKEFNQKIISITEDGCPSFLIQKYL